MRRPGEATEHREIETDELRDLLHALEVPLTADEEARDCSPGLSSCASPTTSPDPQATAFFTLVTRTGPRRTPRIRTA